MEYSFFCEISYKIENSNKGARQSLEKMFHSVSIETRKKVKEKDKAKSN